MIEILTGLLLAGGLVFFVGTVVGVHRFPDFYTRAHAAAKGDTLSSLLLLAGLALYNLRPGDASPGLAEVLVSLKILGILVFLFLASPTATHALIDAGLATKAPPWTRDREKDHGAP